MGHPRKTGVLLLASLLLFSPAIAQSFTQNYEQGPTPLDSSANLSFTIDLETRTARLGLQVTAKLSTQTWVGIGISEPTSGSMLGADIATVQFLRNSSNMCELTDRHVPFVPFPLLTSGGGAPPVFPEEDDCQGGWTLVSCQRNIEKGIIILEVSRGLDADEPQDRDIVPGVNSVIYAFGSSFGYHVGNRASAKVTLYGSSLIGTAEEPLPDDVTDSFSITATNYPVNDQKVTVYACTSAKVPIEKGKKRMIVAAESIINATSEEHVHHLTLFICRGGEYAKLIEKTVECTTGDEIPQPAADPRAGCVTFVYGWAKGARRVVFPREAGLIVDEDHSYLIMETHYDNPNLESNAFDNSGVRVYLTDTLREHEAGTLLLGDPLFELLGQVVKTGFKYRFSCPSECTQKFSQPVNVYSSLLHMHRTGMEIYENKFGRGGRFIENINKVNFWSDNFQNNVMINKRLRPGDQLQLTCLYDTRKLPTTIFGLQTKDEMCVDFLGYWPVQRDPVTNLPINICSAIDVQNSTLTFCGPFDGGDDSSVLPIPNPSFKDRRGAPTNFGNSPDSCPVESDEAKESTSPTSESDTDSKPETDDDSNEVAETTAVGNTEDEGVCFPRWANVATRDGQKRMDEIEVGDEVLIGYGKYSRVFMFTHKDRYTKHIFLRMKTRNETITLTRGHYLYVNEEVRRADMVKIGDRLRVSNGGYGVVEEIMKIWAEGVYNPHTLHGDIVVDGVVTTCYTVRIERWKAHALLAPFRWTFGLFGIDASRIVS